MRAIALGGNVLSNIIAIALAIALCASTAGCSGPDPNSRSGSGSESGGGGTTDELFTSDVQHAELDVFVYGSSVFTVDKCDSIDLGSWRTDLEDGAFYRVDADVKYLDGGVAGYVDYPQIVSVHDVRAIDPAEADIAPLSSENTFGLTRIGDYGDGDYLLYAYGCAAVMADGKWVFVYDDVIELDDGRTALIDKHKAPGTAEIEQRISEGIVSCPGYFALPVAEKDDFQATI